MYHDCNPRAWGPAPRRRTLDRGAVTLAAGTLGACVVLVAPIFLWARFGDAALLRSLAVASASMLLCWVVVRALMRRYTARRLPARALPREVVVPAPAPCHALGDHRTAAQRGRRDPARPCGPSRCKPLHTSRGPRDVSCHAARPVGRHSVRRRTRP